ncbi:MAG: gliding motility-associated C-terminal domain-containing protein, partial [Bacteroidia bacterium]|nr:gliding motility-associated C-terminal domain-containing protein [Bacteroidia bacterium]
GDGSIQVVASGDGRNFYYSINGRDFLDNNGLFENLRPGNTYTISVMADSVCAVPWPPPVTITQPDSLAVKLCTLPPSCQNCTDGNIKVARITGGTPPYQILLNGSLADTAMYGLGPGTYSLTISDSNQCTLPVPVELAVGLHPEISGSVNYPVCTGTPVTLTLTNFNRIEWITPAWGGNRNRIDVNPLVSTIYRVRSIQTDADNFVCDTILEYPIVILPFVSPSLADTVKACAGDTVRLDGGANYRYPEWNNGIHDRYNQLIETFDPLILSVMDDNGCILKDTVSVIFYDLPVVDLGADKSLCSSEPLILTGGSGESYKWSTGALTRDISVTASGKYYLEITTKGCSSSDSVNVKISDPALFGIDSVNRTDNTCFGAEAGSIEIFVHGSGVSFQYSIDDGGTYQSASRFDNLQSGDYNVRISEDSTCYIDYGAPVTIGQPDSIHISYRLRSPGCETCNDGKLTLVVTGGIGKYTITLSGRPIELVTGSLGVGTYTIAVTDENNCTKTVEFELELLNVIPNVITTNGDEINEFWKIPMLKYFPDAVVKVFTVSGKMVFESAKGYPVPWDGKDSGNLLPMGTYYYLINLGPGEQQLTGYLTILR